MELFENRKWIATAGQHDRTAALAQNLHSVIRPKCRRIFVCRSACKLTRCPRFCCCRDWFQLTLKEGLTVFRDQLFSGDMGSHAVKRIEVRHDLARHFQGRGLLKGFVRHNISRDFQRTSPDNVSCVCVCVSCKTSVFFVLLYRCAAVLPSHSFARCHAARMIDTRDKESS